MKTWAFAGLVVAVLLEVPLVVTGPEYARCVWALRGWVAAGIFCQLVIARSIARQLLALAMRVPGARLSAQGERDPCA